MPPVPAPLKRKSRFTFGRVFLFLLIVAGIFIGIPFILQALDNSRNSSSPLGEIARAVQQARSVSIINRQIVNINPGTYQYFKFSTGVVPAPVVKGQFQARGGSHNDINIYIVDDQGFMNIQNGNGAQTYFNQNHATAGNIEAHLPTGARDYYLILDNRMSVFSGKQVGIEASLSFFQ